MTLAYRKIQSAAKTITTKGPGLDSKILDTIGLMSRIVGATLGPGGLPVLIERQETSMEPILTKDGVSVSRSLQLEDSTSNAILEVARSASERTVQEAGDGTTTATVLADTIVQKMHEFLRDNPKFSPQKVVRTIEKIFKRDIEGFVKSLALPVTPEVQRAVILCSSNGDEELTETVAKAFELTGDDGNVTILERSGPSGYKLDQIQGYQMNIGFEESCRMFFPQFINDNANQQVLVKDPVFVLYNGLLNDIAPLMPLFRSIAAARGNQSGKVGVVVFANGFSDMVIATFGQNCNDENSPFYLVPCLIPKALVHNAEVQVLQDLSALTSSPIYDPVTKPLETATVEQLGPCLESFEMGRFRSSVVGQADPDLALARIEELRQQVQVPESKYDKMWIQERMAKLSGGIARITVFGGSSAEIREKRDRVEDAVCAVRGALKHGAVPGGGWGLMKTCVHLDEVLADEKERAIVNSVLAPALISVPMRLMSNCGFNAEEIDERLAKMGELINDPKKQNVVWNGIEDKFVDATEAGILDSVPAVVEALRNSISIATLLGTLGGTVVFQRDSDLERKESQDTYHFLRNGGTAGGVGV